MRTLPLALQRIACLLLLVLFVKNSQGQTLKIEDFAVWGGSAAASSYNNSQGVVIGTNTTIKGNVGTNHLINAQGYFTLSGNIYSGNAITLGSNGKITGNIFAAKSSSGAPANIITGQTRIDFIGNLSAKGKIVLQSGTGTLATTILGQVAVPAPTSSNYSGPKPSGGILNVNTITFPVLPTMPTNMAFDNLAGTTNITNTITLSPGSYKKLALTGNKTITFNGPGDYIFDEVDNGTSANKLVFNFNNTTAGNINIFIVKNAKWGKIAVSMANGNFPSRIYTEVHGNGSTNSGSAFSLDGPGLLPSGNYSWLGNVWAPNGNITIKSFILSTSPQIAGALWSGKKVDIGGNVIIAYQAPGSQSSSLAQTLNLSDFAVWGGSASAGTYTNSQNVTVGLGANINGNIGSNHFIDVKANVSLTGSLYSANAIAIGANGKFTGDIFAAKTAASNTPVNILSAGYSNNFIGNITAKGKVAIQTSISVLASTVSGRVAVPSPTAANYSGPNPLGGISNAVTLPAFPSMPANTPFDNQAGTTNITNTQTISPGSYKKLALTGNKTLTFNGPGNYIFDEVNNGTTANKIVFNFNNTPDGTINIFIIKDAKWGKVSVNMTNGNFPSRIYTEIHGTGSANSGIAFELLGPGTLSSGNYSWLGNVWAPNGGIAVKSYTTASSPQIVGALWSAKKVDLSANLVLSYQAPSGGPSFVAPYYPPPNNGKVIASSNVIGAELQSLTQNTAPISSITENEIFILDNAGKVMIEVVSKTANDVTLKNLLIALGMTGIIDNGPQVFVITGFFPINSLPQLNTNPLIQYVRPLYPAINNMGQVTTQGDSTMRSYNVRSRFGLDGSGIKIGVLSDSYNSKLDAQNDIDQGDLPGVKSNGQPNENPEPVQVVQELARGGSDEGRAMLQIVHDIAPKAKLAFRTGFLTAGDFAKGIQELASPSLPGGRCDVIVDDITYVTEPFFMDGVAAQAVDQAVADGVTYFSSAGNFGSKSYQSVFNGVTNASVIPTGQIHQFGSSPADIYQTLTLKPGTYTIVLQWSDEFYSLGSTAGVQTDMDLYLIDQNGYRLFGFNRSNLFGDPFEVCPFTVKEETDVRLMVVRAAGITNVLFKYIIFRGEGTIKDYQTGTSSIVGHPNSNGAIAVGAMLYANIPSVTPVWPSVASFSSRGGTPVLQNNVYATRNKPELVGPNGVNTTVNLGGAVFNDGDAYPNFFGTSAAAPHVAAVGALLIQGRKKFNLQTTVTPAEIRQQLISSVGKFSPSVNFSFDGGYGYVQADSAALQISNAKPIIDTLVTTVPGSQNGIAPFEVKVKGKYLTSDTKVYMDGAPIANTVVSSDKTEATATVPAIPSGQDPAFQLFNAAKSPSGLDGGLSEALYFFSSRTAVVVRAQNKNRKYGLPNPGFDADVLVNGVPLAQTSLTLADLKLDNLTFTTIASSQSDAGLYGIFPARTTPLAPGDPLLTQYGFTFLSGTLNVEKMPLKITPQNIQLKYGEFPGNISYTYDLDPTASNAPTLLEEVKALHKKHLADNGLIVVNGFNPNVTTPADLANMSAMASFQSVNNARQFLLQNGQLQAIVNNDVTQLGNQRFIVDVSAQSLVNFKTDPANANMVDATAATNARGLLNIKALTNGTAKAAIPNGQLQAMVNGQLLAMVNGQLQAMVNGQLLALVNNVYVTADDIVFQNGQLLALVNGQYISITNGQLQALVNGETTTIDLFIVNGQLQALVNGTEYMQLVNGQLQALVNGQLLALVNGQLQALVNGQLMPLVNGQLLAMVNGQLQALVNGQLLAMVNGQLMALVNGELQIIQDITLANGQLQAIVNGQLLALVNGQLKAMVNGTVTDIPTTDFSFVNGQLQAIVNGQLQALVNGQLMAIVNGQLQALVNGAAVKAESVRQLANGQLQALVNNENGIGTYIPITNGQLQAIVNGQLLAMVNGQLMALVNNGNGDELTFVVFNGQLQALVNGQLQALVNGQLLAMVNGQLQALVNSVTPVNNSYNIVNGQLQALVNNQNWAYANGQLLALVNGQLQALVNNFDVSGNNNNAKTAVLVDEDDITLQSGAVGGMFAMNMITGLDAGIQTIIPGGFVNENYEVTYGLGEAEILPAPLIAKVNDAIRIYGNQNPDFSVSYTGFLYNDDANDITTTPVATSATDIHTYVGKYPITISGGSTNNYSFIYENGTLTIGRKTLNVTADNKTRFEDDPDPLFTLTYNGLAGDDTEDSLCLPIVFPASVVALQQLNRITTHTDVQLNGGTNVIYTTPGQSITLTGNYNSVYYDPTDYCPGCITQIHVGMSDGDGGNVFSNCYEVGGGYSITPGSINRAFNAPMTPGVYYITQETTWWYYCGQFPDPIQNNIPGNAIAVVIVNASENIETSTTATAASPVGSYPIIVGGCYYNPNYKVVLQNGTLTIDERCINITRHVWEGDGNYDDAVGSADGTPVNGVATTGEAKKGTNSFAFSGTGYIDIGTAGSVAGDGNFSVSAWVKTISNMPMVIINQRGSDGNVFGSGFDGEYYLKIGGGQYDAAQNSQAGKAYFFIYDFGNNPYEVGIYSSTLVNDGNWHHIKGERVGNTIGIYVDGILESTGTLAGAVVFNPSIPTYIGADVRDGNSYFDGLIDDIQVSICPPLTSMRGINQPVTSTKPREMYKAGESKLYPNPATTITRIQLKDAPVVKTVIAYDQVGKSIPATFRKVTNSSYEINTSGWQRGIYIIEVRTATGSIEKFKLVKM